MQDRIVLIKPGIKLHIIKTDLFKTNLFGLWQTVKLERETVTKNALINLIQRRGTSKYGKDIEFNRTLEKLYGTNIDCTIEKTGDNESFRFIAESIRNEFLPEHDYNLLEKQIDIVLRMAFEPIMDEQGNFEQAMIDTEKNKLRKIIRSKIDDKDSFALYSCTNAMYGDNGYGLYKYGIEEDVESITNDDLKEQFYKLVSNCKIDMAVSGSFDEQYVIDLINNHPIIKNLNERNGEYFINNPSTERKQIVEKGKEVFQSMNVNQGKLVFGMDVVLDDGIINLQNVIPVGLVYDAIMGNGVNSKLFQNVREKSSLCYSIRSNYLYSKMIIFIRAGIDIGKYKKARDLIAAQLTDMKNGIFDEEDIDNARKQLHSMLSTIPESQELEVYYYISQEINDLHIGLNDLENEISRVTKEEIVAFANLLHENVIYFLKD